LLQHSRQFIPQKNPNPTPITTFILPIQSYPPDIDLL
jgi:hypothetical protein